MVYATPGEIPWVQGTLKLLTGLTSTVRVAKEVRDGASDITQGNTAGSSAQELENDQHGQVQRLGAANVQDGVDGDGADVNPFPTIYIPRHARSAVWQ